MTALHTLGILSTSFTWNAFPTVLKEFSHMLSICWLLFLHSTVQQIPNHLNWVEVGWLWRPGHLMQHSITILLGQIALTQSGGVFRSLSCWKSNDSPTKCKPDGMVYRCRMLWWPYWLSVPWNLNKSLTVSPAKHPHIITPPPPCFMVVTTHADIIRSPTLHLTKTQWLQPKISNWSNVHCSCFFAHASLFFMLLSFSSGFFAAIQRAWQHIGWVRPCSPLWVWTKSIYKDNNWWIQKRTVLLLSSVHSCFLQG